MKKRKTAGACHSSSNQKYINKNLSVHHINTPFRIGQFKFLSQTVIFTQPETKRRGQSRCYYCLQWFKSLGGFGLWKRFGVSAIQYGMCKKCFNLLSILSPDQQRKFAEKCEKNLRNALEGNSDV